MAQRKSGPSAPSKAAKAPAKGAPGTGRPPAGRPPVKRKPGKSIVNQRQTPWGLVATAAVIVIFAAVIVIVAVTGSKKHSSAASSNNYTPPEVAAAKSIQGIVYHPENDHTHVFTAVTYDMSPPVGGNHSQIWADCSGTVYSAAIADENAVHMLEHGAVWITYQPGLAADQVATLSKLVNGVDRMAMSPYPGLKSAISLQAWGYQLFVDNANDPRIQQFIAALRNNSSSTPEVGQGVTCSDPAFKAKPSTFGQPIFQLT